MLALSSILYRVLKKTSALTTPGILSCEQMHTMNMHSNCNLLEMVKSVIPPLDYDKHKGQAGRVAVIGGCKEYTGAPYFAGISALKVGADLSHIFCASEAGVVIKCYSPELIVHPILDQSDVESEFSQWLPRFHSLIIGPGLGRNEQIMKTTAKVINMAKEQHLPLIIDADGLFLITQDHSIIKGYKNVILTPNIAEFGRLYKKIFTTDPDLTEPIICVKQLCRELGNVTIALKGAHDIISDGFNTLVCSEPGSARRCGGQGDLLSGSMGVFAVWAKQAGQKNIERSLLNVYKPWMCAAFAACVLTRECNRLAFDVTGRSMTTSDMIGQIHNAFDNLFS